MNILGISGTPRKGGNSELLLYAALEPFIEAKWEVNKILLSEKMIEPCTGCDTCVHKKSISKACIIEDDMNEIYNAYERCDAIIISSPAYWRNVPAQLKAVIDRKRKIRWCYCSYSKSNAQTGTSKNIGEKYNCLLQKISITKREVRVFKYW